MRVSKVNGIEFPDILLTARVTSRWKAITNILIETDTEGEALKLFEEAETLKRILIGALHGIAGQIMTNLWQKFGQFSTSIGRDVVDLIIEYDVCSFWGSTRDLLPVLMLVHENNLDKSNVDAYLLSQPIYPVADKARHNSTLDYASSSPCSSLPKTSRDKLITALILSSFRSIETRDILVVLGRVMSKTPANIAKMGLTADEMAKVYDYIMKQSLKRQDEFGGFPIPFVSRVVDAFASKSVGPVPRLCTIKVHNSFPEKKSFLSLYCIS